MNTWYPSMRVKMGEKGSILEGWAKMHGMGLGGKIREKGVFLMVVVFSKESACQGTFSVNFTV